MKKFFTLCALATIGLAAVAAPKVSMLSSQDAVISKLKTTADFNKRNDNVTRLNAPARISSVSDVFGPYNMTYIWLLEGDDRYNGSLTPMVLEGESPTQVIFRGMPFIDVDVVADVDVANGTVKFSKQDLYFHPNYNEMVVLQPYEIGFDESGNSVETKVSSVTGTIQPDGSILFPDFEYNDEGQIIGGKTTGLSFEISQGYFFFWGRIHFEKVPYFTFDPSKYTKLENKALFTDNAMNYGLKDEYKVTEPQEVVTYVNADNTEWVLENPYGGEAWAGFNGISQVPDAGNGYLVINTENPEVVLLRPMVGSGLWMDNSEQGAAEPLWEETFWFNEEGTKFYLNGYSTEEIYDEFAGVGDELSYLDVETNTVYLGNLFFGLTSDPLMQYYFASGTDSEGNSINSMTMTIVLPSLSGVNEIAVDNNAPVKYYNLQGMEVVNPVKGQLVIKTQGSKAQKVIVK